MKTSSAPWSLKRKLPLIAIGTSGAALVLACAAFLVYDWSSTRRAAARDLDGLAGLLAEQSAAAMVFQDRPSAETVLASLSTMQDISWAALYDDRGVLFARYVRVAGAALPDRPGPDDVSFVQDHLRAGRPVFQENRRIGTIQLESTLESARVRLNLGILVAIAVLAVSSLGAFLTAVRLARPIVEPVLSLVRTMEQVSRERRYDVSVEAMGGGVEIDRLVRGFNDMISGIRVREGALERMAFILEATPDFVGMATLQQDALYLNRAGRRMVGLGEDENLSKVRISDLHPKEVAEMMERTAFPTALRDGVWRGETELQSRDGRRIPVSQVIMAHKTLDGQPAYFSTILRDLSDIRQAQEALHRSEEQLRMAQKMEALGRLAGGVAHDFNNLLTVIGGYSHMMSAALPAASPLSGQAQEISAAVDRASALTRQLLAFSRRQVIQPRVLDVNATVREAEKMLRRLIGETILLVTRLHPRPIGVKADPGQLDQVLLNLVVNARDAMPKGGTVEITTTTTELDAASAAALSLPQAGSYAVLTVSDTGCGMDAETQSHLFEPFFTTKDKGKGTGLGLSTVYGIVHQRGGGIQVLSRTSEGTEFRIFLPLALEGAPAAGASPAGSHESRARGRLLLVEDERSVRLFMRESLKREGYEVLEATDPIEALRIAERQPSFDLVVSDVVMPTMSGPEMAARLRERRPGLRVLFVSGYPEDELGTGCVLAEGTAFLGKPFAPSELTAKVREVLDRSPANGHPAAGGQE